MKKGGNAMLKPGSLSQSLNKYEKDRMDYIAKNKKRLEELNLQHIKKSLMVTSGQKSLMVTSGQKGKNNKRGRHDDDYYPFDDIEGGGNNSSDEHARFESDGDSDSSGPPLHKVASMPFKRHSTRLQTNSAPIEPHIEVIQSQLEAPQHEIVSNLPIIETNIGGSTTTNKTKKTVRGPTLGLRTERIIARTGKKLPVEISEDSNVPVGENASSLTNELGKEVRRNAPLQGVSTWTDIDESLRKAIIQRALDKFDIKDYDVGDRVLKIIENKCQTRYRSWKCRLHEKYQKMVMNGVDPKSNPPRGVKSEDWNYMIEHVWTVEKWMERSKKAKVARACLPYNHSCGSRSFPATFARMTKEKNNKKPDIVDLFEKTHWSKSKGDWVHPTCKEKHDKFLQVRERCSAPDATPMTDMEMSIEVLGSRPGYLRGLGFGPKPPSTKSTAHSRAQEEEMRNLREVIETQNRQIEAQNKFMEGQNKLMEITMKALQQAGIVPPIENSSGDNDEGTS